MIREPRPGAGENAPFAPDFDPVSLRHRGDGWTPGRQLEFIRWLADGLRPGRAAERVGMSRKSAYALRSRPGGEGFAAAWDSALAIARRRSAEARGPGEWARAIEGVPYPIRYRGRIAAWDRRFDDRALLRLLGRACRLLEKR